MHYDLSRTYAEFFWVRYGNGQTVPAAAKGAVSDFWGFVGAKEDLSLLMRYMLWRSDGLDSDFDREFVGVNGQPLP